RQVRELISRVAASPSEVPVEAATRALAVDRRLVDSRRRGSHGLPGKHERYTVRNVVTRPRRIDARVQADDAERVRQAGGERVPEAEQRHLGEVYAGPVEECPRSGVAERTDAVLRLQVDVPTERAQIELGARLEVDAD